MNKHANPLAAEQSREYAEVLRRFLASLDREIVDAAVIGESKRDLLHSEGEEMDRFREFLNGRILVPLESLDLRSRSLALLDAFKDELLTAEHDLSSRRGADDPIRATAVGTALAAEEVAR